ncbi:TPA: hypothetical protein EYP44_00090 [Candidatus Bathyarchaeota archaeon]|nr:hypothetical protein [Candidatus Bathyarchaeota archaeon]
MKLLTEAAELRERLAKVEGRLEEISDRLNHIEAEIVELRGRIRSLLRWTVGLILAMWVTVMMTLVPILLRTLGVI